VAVAVVLTPMDMDLVDLVAAEEVVILTLDLILVQVDLLTLEVEEVETVLHKLVLVVIIKVLVDLEDLVKL
jgi:hypothetical protein